MDFFYKKELSQKNVFLVMVFTYENSFTKKNYLTEINLPKKFLK